MLERETAMRKYATEEWFDSDAASSSKIVLPEPDEDYLYAATRLLSWYPVINSKGATYEPEDFSKKLLDTLIGKQANLEHDKTRVVGSIFSYERTQDGIDIGIRVDREQAELQGLDPVEMMQGNYFSHVSVELSKDPGQSKFYCYDEAFSIKRTFPVLKGRDMGLRRTTAHDPFVFQGHRVAERIMPARFTGVGFVPNPADTTAQLYAVAADDTSEDRPKLAITTASSDAANSTKEDAMSEAERKAIQDKVEELEVAIKNLREEKEAAATESKTAVELAVATLAAKEVELASVIVERDALKSEKELAARELVIETLLSELIAIHPVEGDEAKAALREKATAACGDDGVIRVLKLERTNDSLVAKLAVLEAKVPEEVKPAEPIEPAAVVVPVPVDKAVETATAEREVFSADVPAEPIAPAYEANAGTGTAAEDLLKSF